MPLGKAPFAEYAPDQPPLGGFSGHVQNVLPLTPTSYGPVKALAESRNSISGTAMGAASFRGTGGTAVSFVGDTTDLYKDSGTTWDSVTRVSGGSYATATDGRWTFAQFENTAIAANGVDVMQEWSIGTSTNFINMNSTSASSDASPVAQYVATVRDFLFAGHLSTNKLGVRWSEQFNHKSWRTGTNQSDSQDLPDNGEITGVVGGQYALVFQQHGINLFTYVGPDLIFQRDLIADDRGCFAPGSIATIEQTTFFYDVDGFYRIDNGQVVKPIGAQRVDVTFRSEVNTAYLHRIASGIDRENKIYFVSYPSADSSNGTPDRMLAYNFNIDRWAKLNFGVDVLFNMYASIGTNLDALDALYPGGIDTIPVPLDSAIFQSSPIKTFAAFKSNKKVAFFEGSNLKAILDTVEAEVTPGRQTEIDRLIPYIDGGTVSALLGYRNRLNDAMTFSGESSQDSFGDIYFREPAARIHRARFKIAAGGTWSHATGCEFFANDGGDR